MHAPLAATEIAGPSIYARSKRLATSRELHEREQREAGAHVRRLRILAIAAIPRAQ